MKILFIGCGEIGSRHIQAASHIAGRNEIFIVDPSDKSKAICKERIDKTSGKNSETTYQWFDALDIKCVNSDICIISTYAPERVRLLKEIHELLNVKNYLIEKVQS